MNKIAARISPAMNGAELAACAAPSPPSRPPAGPGSPPPTRERQTLGGAADDPLARAVAALGLLADRITAVETAITRAADPRHLLARGGGRHASPPADA